MIKKKKTRNVETKIVYVYPSVSLGCFRACITIKAVFNVSALQFEF